MINNTVANASPNTNPWHCKFVANYTVSGNSPPGLADCMRESMHNRSTA